jgi:hypothetical protein
MLLDNFGKVAERLRAVESTNFDFILFVELVVSLKLFLALCLYLLLIEYLRRFFNIRVRVMEPSCLLIGVIFLSIPSNDVLFELLIGIVRVPAEGGSLFEELEDVDHSCL